MPTTLDRTKKKKKRKPCAYCHSIVGLMRPTAEVMGPDDVCVMISRNLFQRVYANAKRGSK